MLPTILLSSIFNSFKANILNNSVVKLIFSLKKRAAINFRLNQITFKMFEYFYFIIIKLFIKDYLSKVINLELFLYQKLSILELPLQAAL